MNQDRIKIIVEKTAEITGESKLYYEDVLVNQMIVDYLKKIKTIDSHENQFTSGSINFEGSTIEIKFSEMDFEEFFGESPRSDVFICSEKEYIEFIINTIYKRVMEPNVRDN